MPQSDPRGHRRYRDWRLAIRKQHAYQQRDCDLCGQPIDYELRYPHKRAWTLEHDDKLDRGGPLMPSDPKAAHQDCNSADGARYGNTKRRLGNTTKDW